VKRDRRLSTEDRIVWDKVARTVRPLRPGMVEVTEMEEAAPAPPVKPEQPQPFLPPYVPAGNVPARRSAALDRTQVERLVKGRAAIEARIDLHGMTQAEAHALLLRFVRTAHAEGFRNVLIITGKGSALGSDGILRRMVPAWLATPPFSNFVASHAEAGRRHGGAGALYVRIRRPDRTIAS
jgi:DNA-nicking Smr family endonuclease